MRSCGSPRLWHHGLEETPKVDGRLACGRCYSLEIARNLFPLIHHLFKKQKKYVQRFKSKGEKRLPSSGAKGAGHRRLTSIEGLQKKCTQICATFPCPKNCRHKKNIIYNVYITLKFFYCLRVIFLHMKYVRYRKKNNKNQTFFLKMQQVLIQKFILKNKWKCWGISSWKRITFSI